MADLKKPSNPYSPPLPIKICLGLLSVVFFASTPLLVADQTAPAMTEAQITEFWHSGKTLPLEIGKLYPPQLIRINEDKGYNILIDISHECSFASLWGLGGRLHGMGFRSVTNQASLDSVLDTNGKCRVRIPFETKEKIYPFAWYPNFKYNVIITEQGNPDSQHYTPAEQEALVRFVKEGGSLVLLGSPVRDAGKMKSWTLNQLAGKFGAELLPMADRYQNHSYATLKLDKEWEVIANGEKNAPVQARRTFGKGKVILAGNQNILRTQKDKDLNQKINENICTLLDWACAGQTPVGGEPRFPQPMGGGGAIYPELETVTGDIVVFYARNQKENLLNTVQEIFPQVDKKVQHWLPSRPTKEPMYLILSAGSGGGWAVNAFRPKENGVISDSPSGLISIYAHELAHTMSGPDNHLGAVAGVSPIPERGEAHAGWFQGKVDAWYDSSKRDKPNRNCNTAFESPRFMELDLKKYSNGDPELRKKFNNSDEWTKVWYIWQKLDDRYGCGWYPRWKWVQHTRWANDPLHHITWEQMVEDMSIAVGEDLFPFFRKIGTSLDRETAGEIRFQGKTYKYAPSPLDASAPGPVRIEDIGDYRKALPAPK
ncbi:MAG: hypothetical protein LBV12_00885 [Puniceicoccales bacterium]|jgi:hypothetical protein|nr:hypothetical protein [Puniceicoccales bacterium]